MSLPPASESLGSPRVAGRSYSVNPSDEDAASCPVSHETLLHLQASLASQPNMLDAMKTLVAWLAEQLPEANVRVAWGAAKPKAVLDHRLGKLGPESSLWTAFLARWPSVSGGGTQHVQEERSLWIVLPSNNTRAEVAVLWIDGTPHASSLFSTLEPVWESVGTVLWSRPRSKFGWRWALGSEVLSWRIGVVIAAALLLALLPVPYRVSCRAVIQPFEQRIVAAPFESTLLECFVEPGDEVKKDDLLLVLDGRPLHLELEALQADLGQALKQQSSALATGKIAESQLAELESRRLQKRIELFEARLARLEVRSPIDGVVVSGDLARSVGTPLEIGKPLLEVAPLERMLVEVEVPEEDIHYVSKGDRVRVRLDASVQQAIEGQLQRVFPQTEVRQEQNVFVGRWEMPNADGLLRPGMQGQAVVYGPKRPLAWPWVRRVYEAGLRAIGW